MTDRHPAYRSMGRHLPHEVIDREIDYVRDGYVHTQNIENRWSLLKHGIYGVFHHISTRYLQMYPHEFDYRASSRKVSDITRFAALLAQVRGRLLWYCQTPQPLNPYA